MEATAIMIIQEIPHQEFGTVKRLIAYLEHHYRDSHHSLTRYEYFAHLYYIAKGIPYETDILQYYNTCHFVRLQNFPDIEELLALAKKRLENGEIPTDWRERLVSSMWAAQSETMAEIPL